MVRFKDDEIIKFLELYKKYECLWNSNHQYYKVKSVRTEAYSLIREAMNLNSDLEVKLKIKSFRDTYATEKGKLQKSMVTATHPAEVYRPKLRWYNLADSFLSHIYGRDGDDCTMVHEDTQDGYVQPTTHENQQLGKTDPQISPASYGMMNHLPTACNNILSPHGMMNHLPTVSNNNVPPHKQPKLTTKHHTRSSTILRRKVNSTQRNSNSDQKDEFFHFGMNVAIQLRSLPLVSALNLQTKFQQMLCEERIACENSRYGDYENERSSSAGLVDGSSTSYQESIPLLPSQNGDDVKVEYSIEEMTPQGGFQM